MPLLAGGYRSALYDLTSDPLETRDVSARWPEERARLDGALSAWLGEQPVQSEAPEPDRKTQEALRALGYAQ